jgi:hypothetical protein
LKVRIAINLRYAKYTMMLIAFALSCLIVAGVRPWG